MIIADHCKPEGWRGKSAPYTPSCAWPEDCYVQWGGSGVVLSQKGSYRTAFFESFPKSPDTFIRGEGATVKEAEEKAFQKFEKISNCQGHEFERRKYTSGAAICKHCGLFMSDVFEPSTKCIKCGKPTNWTTDKTGDWWCEECDKTMPEEMFSDLRKMMKKDEELMERK